MMCSCCYVFMTQEIILKEQSVLDLVLIQVHLSFDQFSRGWHLEALHPDPSSPNYRYNHNFQTHRFNVPAHCIRPSSGSQIAIWDHLKLFIYQTPVDTLEDLTAWIVITSADIANILGMFEWIWQSSVHLYWLCNDLHSCNFEQFL